MQNIEIRRVQNRRSVESLIQDSAIDDSFNYEAFELRKAYNQSIKNLTLKNNQYQKEIDNLKLIIKEHQEVKLKYESKMKKMTEEIEFQRDRYQKISESYQKVRKRLNYVEYKLENIIENRNIVQSIEEQEKPQQPTDQNIKIKNQIYLQLSKVITKKVSVFTAEIKTMAMSIEVQSKIESFLQELILLNPHSEYQISQFIKSQNRARKLGKIIKEKQDEKLEDQDEWKKLQKSLQKLKNVSKNYSPNKTDAKTTAKKEEVFERSPARRRPSKLLFHD